MTIFLCVDAHALQHPEIHDTWRKLFHLSRLRLILEDGIQWEYGFSPRLNQQVTEYKWNHPSLRMAVPPIGSRGSMTVTDLSTESGEQAYIDGVWKWSREIYNAYAPACELAGELGASFRKKFV